MSFHLYVVLCEFPFICSAMNFSFVCIVMYVGDDCDGAFGRM